MSFVNIQPPNPTPSNPFNQALQGIDKKRLLAGCLFIATGLFVLAIVLLDGEQKPASKPVVATSVKTTETSAPEIKSPVVEEPKKEAPEVKKEPVKQKQPPVTQTPSSSTTRQEETSNEQNLIIEPLEPETNQGEQAVPVSPPEAQITNNALDDRYPLIDNEIKELANRLKLTDVAKAIFYDHNPQIFDDPNDPNFNCIQPTNSDIVTLGCWRLNSILLLRAGDIETTAIHELMHAIHYHLWGIQTDPEIKALLTQVAQENPDRISAIWSLYQDHHQNNATDQQTAYYNELYAFIGTEFETIPAELEEHYSGFFDRPTILGFYRNRLHRQEAITGLQQEYDTQMQEYQNCLSHEHDSSVCQEFNKEEAFLKFQECLLDRLKSWSTCKQLRPTFQAYTQQQSSDS